MAPWNGRGFEVFLYGRPEGMTLEHCVLSAAFEREPTTCRDLCVQQHTNVQLTDPTGYAFPVATDSACRNRLLHSRPIEGSEFVPRLWDAGVRSFRAVFNVAGDPVAGDRAGLSRRRSMRVARADRSPEGCWCGNSWAPASLADTSRVPSKGAARPVPMMRTARWADSVRA